MRRACEIRTAGSWNAATAIDRVVLDANERHRRRIALTGERGTAFLLDLPQATALKDGDGLVLEAGAIACWKRCCAASARGSLRSRRRSTRSMVLMGTASSTTMMTMAREKISTAQRRTPPVRWEASMRHKTQHTRLFRS